MDKHCHVVAMMVVVMLITTTNHAAARDNPFCQFARLKPLCNAMVKNATNYNDALKNALRTTLNLNKKDSKQLVPMVISVVQKANSPSSIKILSKCQKKVSEAADCIRESIAAVDDNNKDLIEYYLRTGYITLRDCVDSITEIDMPIPPELSKLAQAVEDYKETALVVFLQAPIESVYNKPMPADYLG